MDFRFTQEQSMIRDSAIAFLADVSDSSAMRAAIGSPGEHRRTWDRIVREMGWQALTIPEDSGGLGLGFVELAIIHEAAGARLLGGPLFATLGAGVSLLRCCADGPQQSAWLPGVAAGEETLAVGFQGPGRASGAAGFGLRYRCDGDGFLLDGQLAYVVDGAAADTLLLVALDSAGGCPRSSRVFRVAGNAPGLSRRVCPTLDQTRALASVTLAGVRVGNERVLADAGRGWAGIEPGLDLARIALAAELLGVAQQSLDMAVAYTLEREQFGRPIAGFQAIKHKAADMMLRAECARSALYYAACTADSFLGGEVDAQALAEAASIAKASCSDAAFANAGEALQMHGGNGFTWEYDVHLYFKRARAGRAMLGTPAWHRERLAAQLLGDDVGEAVA